MERDEDLTDEPTSIVKDDANEGLAGNVRGESFGAT